MSERPFREVDAEVQAHVRLAELEQMQAENTAALGSLIGTMERLVSSMNLLADAARILVDHVKDRP